MECSKEFKKCFSKWALRFRSHDDYSHILSVAIRAARIYFNVEEEWDSVDGYEGMYSVSNFGRYRSHNRLVRRGSKGKEIFQKGRIKKVGLERNGYARMTCNGHGGKERFLIHRAVGTCFVDNENNKPQVNHLDSNPSNNCWYNLDWTTQSENILYSLKHGNMIAATPPTSYGSDNPTSKKVVQLSMESEFIKEHGAIIEAEHDTGISSKCISRVCKGDRRQTGGYRWMYAEEYHKRNK